MSKRRTTLLGIAAPLILALVLLLIAPAAAHHKEDHAQGGGSANENGETVTEDDDTNDEGTENNVVDEEDNEHPSGEDRSVEPGNSGNQGRAASDPDERTNGGVDQPDGLGGMDLADQDGNNGCGNDDDFEDDNNGLCGKADTEPVTTQNVPDEPDTPSVVDDETTRRAATANEVDVDKVLGLRVDSGGADRPVVAAGAAAERATTGALPFTGAGLATFLLIGLGLVTGGGLMLTARRRA